MFLHSFIFGYGFVSTFLFLFLLSWYLIVKLHKVYIRWKNPWEEIEQY